MGVWVWEGGCQQGVCAGPSPFRASVNLEVNDGTVLWIRQAFSAQAALPLCRLQLACWRKRGWEMLRDISTPSPKMSPNTPRAQRIGGISAAAALALVGGVDHCTGLCPPDETSSR